MRRQFRQPDLPVGKVAAPAVVDCWPSSPPRTHASHSMRRSSSSAPRRKNAQARGFVRCVCPLGSC